MRISDDILCLFNAEIKRQGDSYVVTVPQREVDLGDVEPGTVHRVAILAGQTETTSDAPSTTDPGRSDTRDGPPVSEEDVVDVEIEDVGDQGDGIARVGPGYVVIVPDTSLGERVSVEINEVRENMAFAEVVRRYDY